MCGIAGFVNLGGEPADPAIPLGMIERIRHRGPDESGVQVAGPCGLGHVRLSIVDLASGQQPMSTEDGRYWIVFNGEIFNYVELRQQLQARGRRFRTHCDTEVILQLYAEKGPACVHEMNGQWAIAIWDTREQTLFLSRDRMGIRPLYYAPTPERFIFGSEIKSIFMHPDVNRRINRRGLDDIFTIWSIVPPQTAFEGVFELPPGHSLTLSGGQTRIDQYWQLDYPEPDPTRTEEQYAGELLDLLVDSTRLRFTSADVPVGAYLSGGLDSTLITGMVRRFTDVPLRTFSVAFEDAEFDESAFQEQAARYLKVDHQRVLCKKQDIADVFPDVVWHTEQPVVRTAPAPMYILARLVREHGYKVVLTGEGSDEIFGGYDIFKEAKIRQFWAQAPQSRLRPLLLRKLYPYLPAMQKQSDEYLRAFFHVLPADVASPFFSHLPRWRLTSKLKMFYAPQTVQALEGYDATRAVENDLPAAYADWLPFCRAQFLETRYLLPGYLLSSQGDRMAMAHGVEGRFPFLDYRVVKFAARIPVNLKMKVLNEKYLLKKAAGDLIPPFLKKRSKQPYRAPEALSFFAPETGKARSEYVDELLSEGKLKSGGFWNPQPVRHLVEKARRGKLVGIRDGMALVSILSTQLLIDQFIENFGRTAHVGHA